jgi:NAD(P)-dependent dehydrogenase (short-subunit alcohol dehydrogenase family)
LEPDRQRVAATARLGIVNAFVSGGSRGLGLALTRELAGRGWTVVIDARTEDELNAAAADLPPSVVVIRGDVTDADHRQELAARVRELGPLDLLINNASFLGPSPQPNLAIYPLAVLRQVYEVNLVAPLALFQGLLPLLQSGGIVVNITSDAAIEGYAGWGGYGSSKAALEQLSNVMAAEHPELKIYWVDPGDMNTRMQQEAFPGEDVSDRLPPEASVPGILTLIEGGFPSGRYQARQLPDQTPSATNSTQPT